ncbi:transmembrane protein 135 [Drosophila eugracilis]|uniref:transmembrane protein 135 n=1 Tax=Drosophila eugracilis TaxID=29029 RepID=UPI001BD95E91|nr:transmembrane protein 135 [Drosophila eugracilis]XP_017073411.2 transmembrane protein 135 [Drosophila eugracilis]
MATQSKLAEIALNCTCFEYHHPWTKSCACAAAGMMLSEIPPSLRTYATVYVLALIMRGRVPSLKDLKRTGAGILQSTAFLSMNGGLFVFAVCQLRRLLGGFYFSTVAWLPSFLASFACLAFERPERRAPLALYVANVGIETLWKMLEARGLVRSIPNGQVLIMGLSVTSLMYLYRTGLHKTVAKDPTFKALGLILGKEEEGPLKSPVVTTSQSSRTAPINFRCISSYVQLYDRLLKAKHPSCPHKQGCVPNAVIGGLKPFLGGVGLSVGLKLLLNIPKIFQFRMQWRKQIFNKGSLQLGLALGIFSLLFKTTSCGLRHTFGFDDALFAIPAGLIGSVGLLRFPNTTVACYLMWKALQLFYNWGIAEGKLPEVPHFSMLMYGFFTAVLFHSAILEARSLRPSYYKFLMGISGNRISRFNVKPFEAYGLKSQDQINYVIKKLGIDMTSPFPLVALTV